MKLKLDLHTHIWEATGFEPPTVDVCQRVLDQCRARGIDGIAITDHRHRDYAFAFKQLFDVYFPGELLIFPGWEIIVRPEASYFEEYEVGEFLLPNKKVFRSHCHPGHPGRNIYVENIQGIEIDNLLHNWHIDKDKVRAVAAEHNLLLLSVSDAHTIEDIGKNYTEVDLEDLCSRARDLDGWSRLG